MIQTAERFLKIEAIFFEALEAPQEVREELLAARCGGDRRWPKSSFAVGWQ